MHALIPSFSQLFVHSILPSLIQAFMRLLVSPADIPPRLRCPTEALMHAPVHLCLMTPPDNVSGDIIMRGLIMLVYVSTCALSRGDSRRAACVFSACRV